MHKGFLAGIGVGALLFLLYQENEIAAIVLLIGCVLAVGWYMVRNEDGYVKGVGLNIRRVDQPIQNVDFEDIGGQEHAKQELQEALDFLLHRDQLQFYGIRPIKGILLSGPPGTGKTLMAKAAAYYTDSIFVSASGSEFVEKYVGVGARRIRSLFQGAIKKAKRQRKSSAIVFIDEIDVIGGRREGSQHREYDQTLNQLLTEMDGIKTNQEVFVFVIAATNRKDMLDPALLRPGRFDRQIEVDLPDKKARLQILRLHTRNKPLSSDVDLEQVATETFGFSGAQLENVTNEAAIYALREKKAQIDPRHLSQAIDKVLMGEKKDREATVEEKERIAIHELGHAILSELVSPGSVSQISLSPRGQALGYVRHHWKVDRYLYTRKQIEDQIQICLAGAAAEMRYYGNKSTGAKNDYDQANQYAYLLIQTGLSDLGIIHPEWISREKMQSEASKILADLFEKTIQRLSPYDACLRDCLQILMKEENLSGEQFRIHLEPYQHAG